MAKWRKFSAVGFIFLFSVGASASGFSDNPGPFGAGLVLGDPTGLTANYRLSTERSVDGALAWNFGPETGLEIHSDYLWHRHGIFRTSTIPFGLFYGVGLRLRSNNARTHLGPRIPLGLQTSFNQKAFEVFAEVAFTMDLIPSTSADLDFGLGARVYF